MEGPRPIEPEEFESLSELLDKTFTGYAGGMRAAYPLLFDYRNAENLFIFKDAGRVVSHVGIRIDDVLVFGCRLKMASVGSVATDEAYRGKGLATALLDMAEKKAIHEGACITNISGHRGLYVQFGATKVGKAYAYDVPAGDAADGLCVQEAEAGDIFKMERLYEREPVRYHRPLEDWRTAFDALERGSDFMKSTAFLFGDVESPSGYVIVRYGRHRDNEYATVHEYAGYRTHIAGALPAVAEALSRRSVKLRVPDYDPSLHRAAERTGLTHTVEHLTSHSVKVSSLASFARALKPYMEERLGRSGAGGIAFQPGPGGTYDVIVGEEHVPFSVPAFTALAFGTPDREDLEATGFGGGLLGRIFPVPLPLPGLNYV